MPEFNELLEDGEIVSAIQMRLDDLEDSAQDYRTDVEAAKVAGAMVTVLGVGMSASPLIGFLGVMGAIGYAYTVFTDYRATGRFCPVPGIRKGAGQLFQSIAGAAEDEESEAEDPLDLTRSGLSPLEGHEYELLSVADGQICKMLSSLPPAKRGAGYQFLLRRTRLLNSLKLPSLDSCREAIALLPESRSDQAIGVSTQLGAIQTTATQSDGLEVDDWTDSVSSGDRTHSEDSEDDEYAWAKDLIHFPAVLVYGQQGSGKTSFTTWLLRERIKAGHEAEVWDVHRAYGQWKGLPVHGDGMDYEAVDARMGTFTRLVKERYRKISTVEGYKPSWKTAICEEFTGFDGKCENSPSFFKQSLSDFRKVKLCVIYCGHGRTLSTLGGAKGVADMRDGGLIELELEAKIDPVTRELVSAQKGRLKLPNQAPITVKIADWMRGTSDFSDIVQAASPVDEVAIASVSRQQNAPVPPVFDEDFLEAELEAQDGDVSPEQISKAAPVLLNYLKDKTEPKNIREIISLTSLRNALGGGNKKATETALSQLCSLGLVVTDGEGNYWAGDSLPPNKSD